MAPKFGNTIIAAAALLIPVAGAAMDVEAFLPAHAERSFILCGEGGFAPHRYLVYVAWTLPDQEGVFFEVHTAALDGAITVRSGRSSDDVTFCKLFAASADAGAFELPDARPVYGLGGPPLDAPTYYLAFDDSERCHSFSVFDPMALEDGRYLTLVQSLQFYFSDLTK